MDGRKRNIRGRMMRREADPWFDVVLEACVWGRNVGVFVKRGHTTSGWTWARRAREHVEAPWASKYFLVGWVENPIE